MAAGHQATTIVGTPDWYVVLQTNQTGPWTDVTDSTIDPDVVYAEGAPASGPDQTTESLRAVIVNDPGGSPTYSWARTSGSTRITANSTTTSSTVFDLDAGAYTAELAHFNCTVTISGTPRSATTPGSVKFDGTA